jgi:hypothetical protein
VLLVGTACANSSTNTGSPHVLSTPVPVSGFSTVDVSSAFRVTISLGDQEALTIRVNDNLVDRLDVGVSNGTLRIGLRPGLSVRDATLEADLTAVSISGIQVSGIAQVRLADELSGQRLRVGISGMGRLEGALRMDSATVGLSGASQLSLTGNLGSAEVVGSGASQIQGDHLEVGSLTIDLSGASIAAMVVTDTIAAKLSGASILRYGGTPRFTSKDVSGASVVEPL